MNEASEDIRRHFDTKGKFNIPGKDKLITELEGRVDELEKALERIMNHQEVHLGTFCNNSQVYVICEVALKSK